MGRVHAGGVTEPDRASRIATGFDIARALGTQEGRDLTTEAGYQDGTTISLDSDLGRKLAALGSRREVYAAFWPPPEPPVQLPIDLNARTREGHVPVPYNDPERPLERGSHLIVYETEDGVATTATVVRVYGDWVHLDVDWDDTVDAGDGATPEAPLHPDVLALLWHRIDGWTPDVAKAQLRGEGMTS